MNGLFNTIAQRDYLGIDKEGVRKVVEFLRLDTHDISKASGFPKKSIRLDEKIPKHLERALYEIGDTINIVLSFFQGDEFKTSTWFVTDNPLLGEISPRDMICIGRHHKLRNFVVSAVGENAR